MKRLVNKAVLMLMMALLATSSTATIITLATAQTVEAASKVRLNKSRITLVVGKSYTLKTKNTGKKATWKISKNSVARISSKKNKSVKITARKVGTATITARINGKNYKCSVTVVNPKINKTKLTLTVGNSSTLKVAGGTGTIKWKSSNKSIATVSSKGKVTAKKTGTVKITATRNGKKMTSNVTVKANTAWKKAYRSYLNKVKPLSFEKFDLVDIGGKTPVIYYFLDPMHPNYDFSYGGWRGSAAIIYYNNGKVHMLDLGGFSTVHYSKKEKKIRADGMGWGTEVYILKSGKLVYTKDSFKMSNPPQMRSRYTRKKLLSLLG